MNTVYNVFTIVLIIIVVLSLMTLISFAWVVIFEELFELKEKMRVAKAVKESEAK